jgi:UDPglucose 6-dehydrogenase
VKEVKKCLGSDTRIGEKFLNSGPGFGGSCFQKDILALIYLAECKGLTKVANFWQSVIDINNERKVSLFKKIYNTMGENLKNKKIAIFGTAFKKGTCDIR